MLACVICGPCYLTAEKHILEAAKSVDLLEIRLDTFDRIDLSVLRTWRRRAGKPFIYKGLRDLSSIETLQPDYLDIDYLDKPLLKRVRERIPQMRVILSYHNFDHTPENLEAIYDEMKEAGADYIKIATFCHSSLEALRLMVMRQENLIRIPMGDKGRFARLMAPLMGQPLSYSLPVEGPLSSLGLFTYREMIDLYRFHTLSPQTALLALIGKPVFLSYSHRTHNQLFQRLGCDALFVKIELDEDEIPGFFAYRELFEGLAVTYPYKEKVSVWLKGVEPGAMQMGAVNTIAKDLGANTDGEGALNAIEKHVAVRGKKIVILGNGGTAKAIACEAIKRGARIVMIGREAGRAKEAAKNVGCEAATDLRDHCDYDVLVNATPLGMPIYGTRLPLDPELIQPCRVVFDVVSHPKITPLLEEAQKKECVTISGFEMFKEQALGQFKLWLGLDSERVRAVFEEICAEL